ncbi:hypothetical protein [Caballeronia sp. J97]|uniref:hypothetical protein n=1 Tax=Caballeronia sp. J97 TaxID=2805429 RepID=UPI002AAFB906|nr:hypothetical protein [Caballeronia sp. J97]
MSEPLIVVEGNLRLPTLHALTDPSLNYGFQWLPAPTRPVQSRSEFALFAARFVTAYVPAVGLSDVDSPYRTASLWGVFAKEEIPRAMLHLTQGLHAKVDADGARPDPIHLSVGTPAAARKIRFSKPVVTAIAAASSVFIVWLLFRQGPASQDGTSAALPEQISQRAQPGENASVPAVSTTTVEPAPNRPEQTSVAGTTTVPTSTIASAPYQPVEVKQEPAAVTAPAPASTIASTPHRRAKFEQTSAMKTTPRKSAKPTHLASGALHGATTSASALPEARHARVATAPAKPVRLSVVATAERKHDTHVRTAPMPHTEAVPDRAHVAIEPAVRPRAIRHVRAKPVETIARAPSKPSVSMDPATLYQMLQHSPTLDSNAASSGGAANGAH